MISIMKQSPIADGGELPVSHLDVQDIPIKIDL